MSYILLAEAAAWIATHIRSAERADWDALIDAEKTQTVQQAEDSIDSLPLRGQRYEDLYIQNGVQKDLNSDGLAQVQEFPRIIDGVVCDWDHGTGKPIIPAQVKAAVCYEAVAIAKWGDSWRRRNQEQGVKQIQLGSGSGLTETYSGPSRLLSSKAIQIMRRYIGVEIR